MVPAASVSSMVRSMGVVSGSVFFGVFRFVVADFFAELSPAVVSFGAARGPGSASVGERRNASDAARPIDQCVASVSGRVIVYEAGGPMRVVSSPAMRLFQPSQTALLFCGEFAMRKGRIPSRHTERLSPRVVTPGTLPVVTSTSPSCVLKGRKPLSSKRVMYIVFGSHGPMTR